MLEKVSKQIMDSFTELTRDIIGVRYELSCRDGILYAKNLDRSGNPVELASRSEFSRIYSAKEGKGYIIMDDICNKFNARMNELGIKVPAIDLHFPEFAKEQLSQIEHQGQFGKD